MQQGAAAAGTARFGAGGAGRWMTA